ncbi:methyltransferase [Archaeoglobus sulfaticallidus PM70-1]|uniref:Methyltransferase n=1 Tax=Archaeoglobus sulfaticallidus PM70-1 TaxID=387631 RepID=N0BP00_9EURY|nr:METTL5 family protein [Archaeoglobus sulfaticallidus]AGK62065.1 methyltransferase [Archaeoglobus sulfaticallidus PM70-1]
MKKSLEIELEKVSGFEKPKIHLEQYVTPPSLASFIAINARLMGDLVDVLDLGCGTGMISIACSLLSARVVGVDIDMSALKIAKKNAEKFGVDIDLIRADIKSLWLKKRDFTTIMNPPFGIQRRHADRYFILKAFELSEVIYSIHSAGSERFIRKVSEEKGFKITHLWRFEIPLKRTYEFHVKEYKQIAVEVYRLVKI